MLAWMNSAAVEQTLATGKATFFSRSRQALWVKGETSGNVLEVKEVVADCDADTLLLLVDPVGPSCHTGRPSCFFRTVRQGELVERGSSAAAFAEELERTIAERQSASGERSYTRSLLDGGAVKIGAKLREEADELGRALADESEERVASEAADLLYHVLVGLRLRDVPLRQVLSKLAARAGISGHDEKASRGLSRPPGGDESGRH